MSGEEEPSRAGGGCVLVVLAGGALAAVFAVSEPAGVLTVWLVGVVALWRSARSVSDSSATPPPRGVGPSDGVFADEAAKSARGALDPNGVMCILHAVPQEAAENDQ